MRKETFIHFSSLVVFFLLLSLFRGWIDFNYWPLWIGGIVGTLLPDFDHLVYVYLLRPHELTSQRVSFLIKKREFRKSLRLLVQTRHERRKLIFHTLHFQLLFLILTFWVMTSSGSLFGQGIVLAFALHFLVDQAVDLRETRNLENWLKSLPADLDQRQTKILWLILFLILLIFGFLV